MPIKLEDFDGVTAPALPAGWAFDAGFSTTTTPAGGIAPTSSPNVLALAPTGSNAYRFGTYQAADTNGGDVSVSCNFNADNDTFTLGGGVFIRSSTAAPTASSGSYYWGQVDVDGSAVGIAKVVAGTLTNLQFVTTSLLVPEWYTPTLTAIGTALSLSVQRRSDSKWLTNAGTWQAAQVAAVSVVDSAVAGAGYAGLTVKARSDHAYADDWIFSDAVAPSPLVGPFRIWMPPPPEPATARSFIPRLPSPQYAGPPPPRPEPALKRVLAPPDPESYVWLPRGLPWAFEAFRPGIPARIPGAPAPCESIPPRVVRFGPPSAGTPPPLAIMPPGPLRVAYGVAEPPPPAVYTPRRLPSAGTRAPLVIEPPGMPLVVSALVASPPAHSSLPCMLPSAGTPTSTGPGLLIPPGRIVRGWANAGQGGLGGWGSGWPGAGPGWGDGGWGDAGRCDVSPSNYGADGPGTQGSGRIVGGPSGSGSTGGGAPFQLGTVGCCCGPNKVCVVACGGRPVFGATINILSGGTPVASCTTDSTGCCTFTKAGTYTVQVVISGSVVYSATRTLSGTVSIVLGNNSELVCCGGYMIPTNLTLTDAQGSLPCVYWPNDPYPTWYGGHSVQQASRPVTTPDNICVAGALSNGPVRVCYQMRCFAGQAPTFSIYRAWSWVYGPADPVTGSGPPVYYQDGSGFTPGFPCATDPPPACGFPHTDVSLGSADPSSTAPFALSCDLVAQPANSTADPIGGGIVISA